MSKEIQINPKDNVIISLENTDTRIIGHKYASRDIQAGSPIIKYGHVIASATSFIGKGQHVHTHNSSTNLGEVLEYTYKPEASKSIVTLPSRTVKVYERFGGFVGIRNELWIIPTVGCVNGVSRNIIATFKEKMLDKGINLNKLSNFDGIYSFTHPYGCSQMGDDHINTRETLQNIAKHPNAGGVLLLGLGCENNQIDAFMKTLGNYDSNRFRSLVTQNSEDEIDEACQLLEDLFEQMLTDERKEKPISVLNIGLECGGSDGLSGITANPLVGRFSDYLVHYGGTSVLTEVPEMFGAETQLMNRCINKEVFNKTVEMVNGFKAYYKAHDQVIYDNPSPGNKKGGITTLEDKSLGCVTKSGHTPVVDILRSTQTLKTKGLNLISAPGNDAVATTTLGMCGCHMVLFTTGRGTPFGGFIPTIKIASNHALAEKKKNWIDFDAGLLVGGINQEQLLEDFVELILEVAEGRKTRQEINNYREIAIFKSGVTL